MYCSISIFNTNKFFILLHVLKKACQYFEFMYTLPQHRCVMLTRLHILFQLITFCGSILFEICRKGRCFTLLLLHLILRIIKVNISLEVRSRYLQTFLKGIPGPWCAKQSRVTIMEFKRVFLYTVVGTFLDFTTLIKFRQICGEILSTRTKYSA